MKANKTLVSAAAMVALMVSLGADAMGNTLTIDRTSGYYSGSAGEFTITPADGPLLPYAAGYSALAKIGSGMQTFCLEDSEFVTTPGTYHYDLNSYAIHGGNLSGDTVSIGVGYLYSQFAQGILSGYSYTPGSGRVSSAGLLQAAIWHLEDEQYTSLSNPFLTLVAGVFGSVANAAADLGVFNSSLVTAASFGVGAVNLGDAPEYPHQDQLYYNQGGNTQLPDGGATLVLLGMAMVGMTYFRRQICH